MKPNWEDAPEWAKWLAMDSDGQWTWFSNKPLKDHDYWDGYQKGQYLVAQGICGWNKSLEKRP